MTCHARTDDATANTPTKMADLAAEAGIWWGSAGVRALMTNGCGQDQVQVQDLSPAGLSSIDELVGTAGTRGSGSPVSSQDSLVITKQTGLAGEAFRGRMFTWGALATDLDAAGGLWDASFAALWTAQFLLMITAFAAATTVPYVPVLWHRDAGQGGVPAADSVTEVISGIGRTQLASVKGRRD